MKKEHIELLEIVTFAFTKRTKPSIGLMVCESKEIEGQIYKEVKENLKEYKHHSVTLDQTFAGTNTTSLYTHLKKTLPQKILNSKEVTYVVHIFDLAPKLQGEIKLPTGVMGNPVLIDLNMDRELLCRNFPFILMFWVDYPTKHLLRNKAPDLYSWLASDTFTFMRFETAELVKEINHLRSKLACFMSKEEADLIHEGIFNEASALRLPSKRCEIDYIHSKLYEITTNKEGLAIAKLQEELMA